MSNTTNIQIDNKLADAIVLIQALRDCGAITISDETAGMHSLWERLDNQDKIFFAGMVRGILGTMGGMKK